MQIDWEKTLDDIFADKLTCPRCGSHEQQPGGRIQPVAGDVRVRAADA